jgi:hypothetical protein
VTRFYLLDDANAMLEELEPILLALQEQRLQLIELRDQVLEAEGAIGDDAGGSGPASDPESAESTEELRLTRLRMQGLIDQMQAGVARLDAAGVVLRDIESGLVDFPALVNGRQVWLCWRLGEDEVGWWHELSTGVAGRQPIADLA